MVDTAGILEPRDLIEQEAIKRSHHYIENADLVLLLLDGSRALSVEDKTLIEKVKGQNILVVINKCDLKSKIDIIKVKKMFKGKTVVSVSALKKIAIKELEDAIVKYVWRGKVADVPRILISNARHVEALKNCTFVLEKTGNLLKGEYPLELASEEIKTAVNYLDNITGRNIDNDLIDKIFSEFCIGK